MRGGGGARNLMRMQPRSGIHVTRLVEAWRALHLFARRRRIAVGSFGTSYMVWDELCMRIRATSLETEAAAWLGGVGRSGGPTALTLITSVLRYERWSF